MFDLIFSTLVIILVLCWLFPIIALLIRFSSKGPILFKQPRSGVNNEEFLCYKFRSMSMSDDADSKQAIREDPRITRVGAFLRKTSLEEFIFMVFLMEEIVVQILELSLLKSYITILKIQIKIKISMMKRLILLNISLIKYSQELKATINLL